MSPKNQKSPRLFLIDGTALAYRSYFGFIRNPLINSKGVNTSGVFGFTNSMMKLLRDEKPDYIACVFDTKSPTFRHKIYPEYKATRKKMPDELRDQFPEIRKIVEAFQIPILEKEGFEADDVIGTLAREAEAQDLDVYMVTGDKDFMQLVSSKVKMYIMGKSDQPDILTPAGVKIKMGVDPGKIIDLLGLMGDSSDNVPGVPGVGPKTALELLSAYESMEGVLEHAKDVKKNKVRENLVTYKDQALLSKDLVTIRTNVPLEVSVDQLKAREMDREKVLALFKELEFSRMLDEVQDSVGEQTRDMDRHYQTVRTKSELDTFVQKLKSIPMFSVDLETTSLDSITAEIVGFSFSWKAGEAAYVPFHLPDEPSLFSTLEILRPVLENPDIRKCGQNIKYDMRVLKRQGVQLQGVDFDSMVAAYLINPSMRRFGIDNLAMEYLRIKKIPTTDLIGSGRNQISMADVPLEKVADYACEDADVAFRLREILEPKLAENDMLQLFHDVEIPLIQVLMDMEENGVALDLDMLKTMSEEMDGQLQKLIQEIYDLAGETFNINSTQQLGSILFEKMKVHEIVGGRRPKRTKTGYSTDVNVLESLSAHSLPRKLLDYRQLTKLKSTYVDALPKLVSPVTNRVHASFNQAVTATGRLSSSDPNLQNIPIRTELGRTIRKAFVPEKKDWVILSADYSQIELRIMAHLSGDETLLESFQNGEDVHRRTASEMFDIPQEAVTADHRRQAKTINFGIMYGMGPYGLASRLKISFDEAHNFISAYFVRYPKVNTFIARTIAQAHEKGFVTTLLNRRRYLPELKSDNRNVREFGERTAVNTPIQGTAADLIKIAMIRISEKLKQESWQAKMILQIHDELVFEAPETESDKLAEMVRKEMEGAIDLSVPIKVDMGVGESWFEAH